MAKRRAGGSLRMQTFSLRKHGSAKVCPEKKKSICDDEKSHMKVECWPN